MVCSRLLGEAVCRRVPSCSLSVQDRGGKYGNACGRTLAGVANPRRGRPRTRARAGEAAGAFRVRRIAHGKPIQDCFILHRPRNRQTCLPSGLRPDRGTQLYLERLRSGKRAFPAVSIGRQAARARRAQTSSMCSHGREPCTSDQKVRSTSRSRRWAGSGGELAASASFRTRSSLPRPGSWSARTG